MRLRDFRGGSNSVQEAYDIIHLVHHPQPDLSSSKDSENSRLPFYFALGIAGGELEYHLWATKKEAEDFYKNPKHNARILKGWEIPVPEGQEKNFINSWNRTKKLSEDATVKIEKSIERIIKKLPDKL